MSSVARWSRPGLMTWIIAFSSVACGVSTPSQAAVDSSLSKVDATAVDALMAATAGDDNFVGVAYEEHETKLLITVADDVLAMDALAMRILPRGTRSEIRRLGITYAELEAIGQRIIADLGEEGRQVVSLDVNEQTGEIDVGLETFSLLDQVSCWMRYGSRVKVHQESNDGSGL